MTRRGKEIFLLSVAAAAAFFLCATFAGWLKRGFPEPAEGVTWLLLLVFVTSVASPLLFAISWALFRHKERSASAAILLGWSALLGCLLGLLPPNLSYRGFIPLAWLIAVTLTSMILPNIHFPMGLCFKCGYDLTGNVSGRCPECGLSIAEGEFLRSEAMTSLKEDE